MDNRILNKFDSNSYEVQETALSCIDHIIILPKLYILSIENKTNNLGSNKDRPKLLMHM